MTDGVDPLDDFFVGVNEAVSRVAYDLGETRRDESLEYLAFWAGDEEYAISIGAVQELLKVPVLTRVPRVSDTFLGIVSLRGVIVPVQDLRRTLGLTVTPPTKMARILVLSGCGDPVGILVDRVTGVVRFQRMELEPTPSAMRRGLQ